MTDTDVIRALHVRIQDIHGERCASDDHGSFRWPCDAERMARGRDAETQRADRAEASLEGLQERCIEADIQVKAERNAARHDAKYLDEALEKLSRQEAVRGVVPGVDPLSMLIGMVEQGKTRDDPTLAVALSIDMVEWVVREIQVLRRAVLEGLDDD